MKTTTTRRSLLKAAPAAAVALAIPVSAASARVDRTAWEAAVRACQQVQAESDAFDEGYWPLYQRCKAKCAAIPHVVLRPDPYTGRTQSVSTEDQFYVRRARRTVIEIDAGKAWIDRSLPGIEDHYKLQREVAAAADERDAAIQAVRDRYGIDEADERSEALTDRLIAARDTVMEMPAPDLAALRWKLDLLTDGGWDGWSDDYVEQTLADIARLLPEGA